MQPLTLIDARHTATVGAWVSRASLIMPEDGAWIVAYVRGPLSAIRGGCHVSLTSDGLWITTGATDSHTQHQDRAALVAYVVAWARAL